MEAVVVDDPAHPRKRGRAQRKAEAEAMLAKRVWRSMRILELRDDPKAPERKGPVGGPFFAQLAVGQGLRVTYREPMLAVHETGPKGRELVRRKARELSFPIRDRCPGCGCPAPFASIAEAAADSAAGVLLLAIQYDGGSDVCWEPDESRTAPFQRFTSPSPSPSPSPGEDIARSGRLSFRAPKTSQLSSGVAPAPRVGSEFKARPED